MDCLKMHDVDWFCDCIVWLLGMMKWDKICNDEKCMAWKLRKKFANEYDLMHIEKWIYIKNG